MNPVEMALQSWRQQKVRYEKMAKTVIAEIAKPVKFLPCPQYESKLEEFKEYLKYNYTYQEDDCFNEVYVHHISGAVNMTLMELANKLVQDLGGTIKFWQNKILDIASNTNYHSQFSMWQVNRAFQRYMGLSPQYTNNLRKKKSLAKNYLLCLTSICKLIEKSKACQEDFLKIDESFKKLKKAEEKYYAFMEEIQDMVTSKTVSDISQKGKNQAKNSLFMFLKPKEDKVNTLKNYNFLVHKEENQHQSNLLKGKQYEQFDDFLSRLRVTTKSQGQSIYNQTSQSTYYLESKEQNNVPISQLRLEFSDFVGKKKLQIEKKQGENQNTFIWSKEYYFSYWGFPVKYEEEINFTKVYKMYDQINYQIDSEEEYDQLNAEDLQCDDELSDESSVSQDSFVVDDDYASEEERDNICNSKEKTGSQRWFKQDQDLKQYEIICTCRQESLPLYLQQTIMSFQQTFVEKMQGKSRAEIMALFDLERKQISKNRIESLLKKNFKKVKNKSKQLVYVRLRKSDNSERQNDVNQNQALSDQDTNEVYEISISCPTKMSLRSVECSNKSNQGETELKSNNLNNSTIIQQPNSYDK